jgi:hypothetical protein
VLAQMACSPPKRGTSCHGSRQQPEKSLQADSHINTSILRQTREQLTSEPTSWKPLFTYAIAMGRFKLERKCDIKATTCEEHNEPQNNSAPWTDSAGSNDTNFVSRLVKDLSASCKTHAHTHQHTTQPPKTTGRHGKRTTCGRFVLHAKTNTAFRP